MSNTKKPYRVNGQDVVVKAENALYSNNEMNGVADAEAALDNLHGRLKTVEQNGGGSSSGSSQLLQGKTFAFIGDSFSHPGKWQRAMLTMLGATGWKMDGDTILSNVAHGESTWAGTGGSTSAYGQAKLLKALKSNDADQPDYILCCLGTNDAWAIYQNATACPTRKLGSLDYHQIKAYTRTIGSQETYDGYGYIYTNAQSQPVNEFILDANGKASLYSYARHTSWLDNSGNRQSSGCYCPYLDPEDYIYGGPYNLVDNAVPEGITVNDEREANNNNYNEFITVTNRIDSRWTTGGMQAAIEYLQFHFPNSIIKIGYTPAGLIHSAAQKCYASAVNDPLAGQTCWKVIVQRLKEVADLYGVGYLDTLWCEFSPMCGKSGLWGGNHPNDLGFQRIGQYMARLMLSNL